MAFLAFEGLDGSGKSTLIRALANELKSKNIPFVQTREPGGTPLGERVRKFLIQKDKEIVPTPWTELFLYEACRRQHVDQVIRPALKEGKWVLCDRYWASTYAFQAGGRELDKEKVQQANMWATEEVQPDLWVFLNLTLKQAQERCEERTAFHPLDRFEMEDVDFHKRVLQGYLELSKNDQYGPWLIIDANQPTEILIKKLLEEIQKRKW